MKSYIFDSYAMIAFFEDEPGAETVAEILRQVVSHKATGYMSVINWGEIYYSTCRERGPTEAETVVGQLAKYPIELVTADKELTFEAAILKSSYPIAYADCFAAALAMKLNAPLVTGDPEFRQLREKLTIQWIGA